MIFGLSPDGMPGTAFPTLHPERSDTVVAPAVEGQVAVVDHCAGLSCGGGVQLLGYMQGMEVADRAAAGADEVDMAL